MSSFGNYHFLERNGLDSEPWTSLVVADNMVRTFVRPASPVSESSPVSDAKMPESSPSPIPVAIYSEFHPLVPTDLLEGPPSDESVADLRPDIDSGESNVRRFLAIVKEHEPSGKGWALVRTLKKVELMCSTKGCEGLGRLHVGQLVQIRHRVSGKFEGQTFVECAAEQCSRATSLAGSRAPSPPPSRQPSRPPSPDGDWVKVE